MFRPTITITITRNIKEAYYYYFTDYYYYYPITITFIITFEPRKHNTNRLQSNIQRHLLLLLYHTLPQRHYHRYYHYKTELKILWRNTEVKGKVIVYYWQMRAPITITITGQIWPDYYYYYYYYSGILRSLLLLLLLLRHKSAITITITVTISNSLTTLLQSPGGEDIMTDKEFTKVVTLVIFGYRRA